MNLTKPLRACCLAAALLLTLSGCAPQPDPHEGMICVNTGLETQWIPEAEGVEASSYNPESFSGDGNIVSYMGEEYDTMLGVDVSFYQGEIDWKAAAKDGVEFAMIRCGYRGSSEGELFKDEQFEKNMKGAAEAGIKTGVYFFSQATGAVEGAEEALFVLDLIRDYKISMPVAFDWEPLDGSRSSSISSSDLTSAAVVFCEMIKDAGYEPAVYFFRALGYFRYDLSRLAGYEFWVGAPGPYPDFYYRHGMWQFSCTGKIDGIEGDTDLDISFVPIVLPEPSPSPK